MDDFYPITFFSGQGAGKTIQVSSGKQNRLILSEAGDVTGALGPIKITTKSCYSQISLICSDVVLCESCRAD